MPSEVVLHFTFPPARHSEFLFVCILLAFDFFPFFFLPCLHYLGPQPWNRTGGGGSEVKVLGPNHWPSREFSELCLNVIFPWYIIFHIFSCACLTPVFSLGRLCFQTFCPFLFWIFVLLSSFEFFFFLPILGLVLYQRWIFANMISQSVTCVSILLTVSFVER